MSFLEDLREHQAEPDDQFYSEEDWSVSWHELGEMSTRINVPKIERGRVISEGDYFGHAVRLYTMSLADWPGHRYQLVPHHHRAALLELADMAEAEGQIREAQRRIVAQHDRIIARFTEPTESLETASDDESAGASDPASAPGWSVLRSGVLVFLAAVLASVFASFGGVAAGLAVLFAAVAAYCAFDYAAFRLHGASFLPPRISLMSVYGFVGLCVTVIVGSI